MYTNLSSLSSCYLLYVAFIALSYCILAASSQRTVTKTVFTYVTITADDPFATPIVTADSSPSLITPFPELEYQQLERRQKDDPAIVTLTMTVTIYVPGRVTHTDSSMPTTSSSEPSSVAPSPTASTLTIVPLETTPTSTAESTSLLTVIDLTPTPTTSISITTIPQVTVAITLHLGRNKELTCEYNATQLSDVQYQIVQKVKQLLKVIKELMKSQRMSAVGKFVSRLTRAVEMGLNGDCKIADLIQKQDFF